MRPTGIRFILVLATISLVTALTWTGIAATTSDQVSIKQLMGSAERFEREGNPEKAAELYSRVLKRVPDHKLATERLAALRSAEDQIAAGPQSGNPGDKPKGRKRLDFGAVASKTRAALSKIPSPRLPKVSLPGFLRRGKTNSAAKKPLVATSGTGGTKEDAASGTKPTKRNPKASKVVDFGEVAAKTRAALRKIPAPRLPTVSLPPFARRKKDVAPVKKPVAVPVKPAKQAALSSGSGQTQRNRKSRKTVDFSEVAAKTRAALAKIPPARLPTVGLPEFLRREKPAGKPLPIREDPRRAKSRAPRAGANIYERLRNDPGVDRFNDHTIRGLKALRPSFMRATPFRRRRARSRRTSFLMMPIQKPKAVVSRDRQVLNRAKVESKTREALAKITPAVKKVTPKIPELTAIKKLTPKVTTLPAVARAIRKPLTVVSRQRRVLVPKKVGAKTREALAKITPTLKTATPKVPKFPAIAKMISSVKKRTQKRTATPVKPPLAPINERARSLVASAKASLAKLQVKRPMTSREPKKQSPLWPQLQQALRSTREKLARQVYPEQKPPAAAVVVPAGKKLTIPSKTKVLNETKRGLDKVIDRDLPKGNAQVRTVAVEEPRKKPPELTPADRIRLAGHQLAADATDVDATTVLIEWVASGTAEDVELAAYLLGVYQPRDKRVVETLKRRLSTTNGHVRVHVAEALLRNDKKSAEATGALISQLKSGSQRVRMMSALAMHAAEGVQRQHCVVALMVALEDDDANVRAAAAAAVGGFGSDARIAAPALKKLAKDENADTARVAGVALQCVTRAPSQ